MEELNSDQLAITGLPQGVINNADSVAMTPQEIADAYNVLSGQVSDYANVIANRTAQAQASYGPLASAVRGGSRTADLGNYTYNRVLRPTVDVLKANLVAKGMSDALNRQLSEAYNQALENYNRAGRRYSTGGGGGGTKTPEDDPNKFEITDDVRPSSSVTPSSSGVAGSPLYSEEPNMEEYYRLLEQKRKAEQDGDEEKKNEIDKHLNSLLHPNLGWNQ